MFDSRLLLGPVIPNRLKMGVVSSCMVLTMKEGPRNITGRPGDTWGSGLGVPNGAPWRIIGP